MIFAAIFFILILILLLYLDCRKPQNFPPGPKWYPILGSILEVKKQRDRSGMLSTGIKLISDQYNQHGVVGLKIGKDKTVFATTYESIKEILLNENIDGRPKGIFYETRTWNSRWGVILTDEDLWQEQRRFVVRHLKDFGFSRRGMTDIIQNESEYLLEDMKEMIQKHGGKEAILPMEELFNVYVLNTLWTMMAGVRYNKKNAELKHLQQILHKLFASIDMMGAIFSHFPLLSLIAPTSSGFEQFVDVHKLIHIFIKKEVEKHKEFYKFENEPRDLMDVYLRVLESPDKKDSYTEKQLLAICLDMFLAGSETTTKTMGFALLYLVRNQELQKKVQEEIDTVIGRERLPKLEDKINMPLCEAVGIEAVRLFMGWTFGIPHRALRDTKICGYNIPKDTMLIPCFQGLFFDDTIWKDSRTFRPERFIKNGKLFIPEYYIPFGIGKRRCIGEMMGKSNLFLFITTLIQNFQFLIPDGEKIPSDIPLDGATPSVRPYKARVVPR